MTKDIAIYAAAELIEVTSVTLPHDDKKRLALKFVEENVDDTEQQKVTVFLDFDKGREMLRRRIASL